MAPHLSHKPPGKGVLKWAQGALASAIGTQEPVYGPEAIQTVVQQAEETPYTELKKEDLKWKLPDSTNVETRVFYDVTDDGKIIMSQIIYSNVAGLRVTVQFCAKVFYRDGKTPNFWVSERLSNVRFDKGHLSFYADDCSVELSEDGTEYHIKSENDKNCKVDVKYKRTTPGFVAGKDGTTHYGTDPAKPWGSMYHSFWPRCKVEGTYKMKDETLNLAGTGIYIHALQGMKPHHAAARWNFVNFKTPSYSAVMMEFTTPPSYGSTVVNVGAIATDDKLLICGAPQKAQHLDSTHDEQNDWPAPTSAKYTWHGITADDEDVEAVLEGSLGQRMDKVDVMAEVPGFVKEIVSRAANTKPYIYQYGPDMKLKVKIGDKEVEEEGTLFTEATFIC